MTETAGVDLHHPNGQPMFACQAITEMENQIINNRQILQANNIRLQIGNPDIANPLPSQKDNKQLFNEFPDNFPSFSSVAIGSSRNLSRYYDDDLGTLRRLNPFPDDEIQISVERQERTITDETDRAQKVFLQMHLQGLMQSSSTT
eukprot:CAMPEP_0177578608 /NCGR_PEP_ID=MMETSP0419_2-20121207/447_1 /TAXON_ID=582737 /ORGANISM="Tetraselmis sp., Strain GSL018" /LENGTH=145 /DNA_ID=CAMNT_0019067079 /DNA_START=249 /DNA_END=687 /DNA_ORIENTATION=+